MPPGAYAMFLTFLLNLFLVTIVNYTSKHQKLGFLRQQLSQQIFDMFIDITVSPHKTLSLQKFEFA
jgi:hypothetical protein